MKILEAGRNNCDVGWRYLVSVILCLDEIIKGEVSLVVSQNRRSVVASNPL